MNKLERLLNAVDDDMLMDMVNDINNWDNSLSHLEFIETEQLDEYFYNESPSNIADMIYYGDFNPKCVYFKINEYGNIISYNTYEVLEELDSNKEDIVKRFIYLYDKGNIYSAYQEICDILDNKEDQEC